MYGEHDPPARPERDLSAAYVGWRKVNRPGARWQAVSGGQSEGEAFRRLLDSSHEQPEPHASLLVLKAGEKP